MNGHLSLFSGIGGLDLAAEWAGFRTVAFVERDKYCQRVLARHWPGVPIFDDVCKVTADTINIGRGIIGAVGETSKTESGAGHQPSREVGDIHSEALSILSGGFPCQPHSVAGKRQASLDERDLWGECVRITDEFRPRWCVFENVPGLLTSERGTFFARVLGDMAALGYRVGWGVWGANDVGAVHKRDRVFIVAHRNCEWMAVGGESVATPHLGRSGTNHGSGSGGDGNGVASSAADGDVAHAGCSGIQQRRESANVGSGGGEPGRVVADVVSEGRRREREDVADTNGAGSQGRDGEVLRERADERTSGTGGAWRTGPTGEFWGVEPPVGRVAHGVPRRVDRLRALGNAVVPQQAYPLFKAIADIEGIA